MSITDGKHYFRPEHTDPFAASKRWRLSSKGLGSSPRIQKTIKSLVESTRPVCSQWVPLSIVELAIRTNNADYTFYLHLTHRMFGI